MAARTELGNSKWEYERDSKYTAYARLFNEDIRRIRRDSDDWLTLSK